MLIHVKLCGTSRIAGQNRDAPRPGGSPGVVGEAGRTDSRPSGLAAIASDGLSSIELPGSQVRNGGGIRDDSRVVVRHRQQGNLVAIHAPA